MIPKKMPDNYVAYMYVLFWKEYCQACFLESLKRSQVSGIFKKKFDILGTIKNIWSLARNSTKKSLFYVELTSVTNALPQKVL